MIDCNKIQAIFISKIHSLNQEFILTVQMLFWNCIILIVVVFMDLVFGTWVPNVFQNCIQHGILPSEFFLMYLEIRRYLIESILQCLHVKTMLAIRFVSFYETIEASSKSVNLSDLSKMLVKKQMKYFDVSLDHIWKKVRFYKNF